MPITNNLERELGCYIAEILLSDPDLLSYTRNKFNETLQLRKPTHSKTHEH